jgi:hypothetical protein
MKLSKTLSPRNPKATLMDVPGTSSVRTVIKKGFLPQRVFFIAFISGSLKVRRYHNAVSRKTGVGTALEPVPS